MIEIEITPEAVEELHRRMAGNAFALKLKYETDGCGCAVSGVPILQLIEKETLDDQDVKIETNQMDIYIEKNKAIFYDEKLKVNYSSSSQTFQLSSPGEILNGRMSCQIQV